MRQKSHLCWSSLLNSPPSKEVFLLFLIIYILFHHHNHVSIVLFLWLDIHQGLLDIRLLVGNLNENKFNIFSATTLTTFLLITSWVGAAPPPCNRWIAGTLNYSAVISPFQHGKTTETNENCGNNSSTHRQCKLPSASAPSNRHIACAVSLIRCNDSSHGSRSLISHPSESS